MDGDAPSMAYPARQTGEKISLFRSVSILKQRFERWAEAERDQLPLWIPVALAAGIGAWFILPGKSAWGAFILAALALAALGFVLRGSRAGQMLLVGGATLAAGCLLIWVRADWVAAPVLDRPGVVSISGRIEQVQELAARDAVRVLLRPVDAPTLPFRIRVNLPASDAPTDLATGDMIRLNARLMPPPPSALPGAYDFALAAWFQRIGATGRSFGPVERIGASPAQGPGLRERLSAHIRAQLAGGEGAIAAALATGDQGAMPEADAEAMRRSGLAHLLSVSGLHITAVVGFAMIATLRLLALSETLALRAPLLLIAAGAGALSGIGYTLLTGAEVPTIRSCVAALLVLGGLALGREAMTLRLVAAGAIIVLLFWPESLVGASFQLSFAAVTAIVAFHESRMAQSWFAPREEGALARGTRMVASLLLTGFVVEIALAPIALFHFHKQGLYGALANIVAIPLTTFVIMPLEALALLFDAVGLGAPFWWLAGKALALLLAVAHHVADAPGAIAMLPSVPRGAFGLMVAGGLWIMLWKSRVRSWGLAPLAAGAVWAIATPPPDLLVTGDGRHVAIRTQAGSVSLLRPRTGDYMRDLLAESAGLDGEPDLLDALPGARCSRDACIVRLDRGGREWRILALRSSYLLPYRPFIAACGDADIVISDRRLPAGCKPRWLKLDRPFLAQSGGLSIALASGRIVSVASLAGDHPWVRARQ